MIFLSYSRQNKHDIYTLESEMRQAGIPYHRDVPLVEGDPFWRKMIKSALDCSHLLVVLWSRQAQQSPYIAQEIRAFNRDIVFIELDDTPIPIPDTYVIDFKQAINLLCELVPERVRQDFTEISNDKTHHPMRMGRVIEEEKRLEYFTDNYVRRPNIELLGGELVNTLDRSNVSQVENFYLTIDPVTNLQYSAFIETTGYPSPPTWKQREFSLPNIPVTGITWFEAQAYAAWVGGTLPTEAEWEKAARINNNIYSTATGELNPSLAHYGYNLAESSPCAVDAFPPNANGLRGMCGNVWDWCMDQWDSNRIIKGGGYMDNEFFCEISSRYRNFPIDRDCCIGFRVKIEI